MISRFPVLVMDPDHRQEHGEDGGRGYEAEFHQARLPRENRAENRPLEPEAEVGQDGKVIEDLIPARSFHAYIPQIVKLIGSGNSRMAIEP